MIDIIKKEHNQTIPRPWQTVERISQAISAIRAYAHDSKIWPIPASIGYREITPDLILWAEQYIDTEYPIAVLKYPGDLTVTFYAFTRSSEN